jgi:cell division protein FtsI/penicillin-binding protein 2
MTRAKQNQEIHADKTQTRMLVIALVLFTWMLAIFFRLAWLQIARHEEFVGHAAKNQQKEIVVKAPRGEITDRNEVPFAQTVLRESLYADPRMLKQAKARTDFITVLAKPLGYKEPELASLLETDSKQVWLKRPLPFELAFQVRQVIHKNRIGAATFVKESQRFYPNETLAAHVIGSVDKDGKGLEGLEKRLDDKLQGQDGKLEIEQDALGNAVNRLDTSALSGAKIVTTIDSVLQHKVECIIEETLKATRARSVSAIVLDPATGEVLTLANAPSFNPNLRPKVLDEARRNRAITDAYEPGSVFKLVAYAGALEEGLAHPEDLLNCQGGAITLGKHVFHDSHLGMGTVTVETAFGKSSNVGAIKIAQKLGEERFYQWITRFGFGAKTGLDLPGEVKGFLRPTSNWHNDSIGSLAIGQEISVTALQTLMAYATVANRGEWVKPHLVKQIKTADGRVLVETPLEKKRVLSERTAEQMTAMMRFVVDEGTGKAAGKLAGYTAAGKTGTPEKFVKGVGYKSGKFTPTFVGFVPATKPRFAIIVLIDEPIGLHQGGQVSAPVFNLIAQAALTDYLVEPDDERFRAELAEMIAKAQANAAQDAAAQAAKAPKQTPTPAPTQAIIAVQPTPKSVATPQTTARRDNAQNKGNAQPVELRSSVLASVMPDLRGQGVRAVALACSKLSLRPKLSGSGQAVRQAPQPGARVKPGDACMVEFR